MLTMKQLDVNPVSQAQGSMGLTPQVTPQLPSMQHHSVQGAVAKGNSWVLQSLLLQCSGPEIRTWVCLPSQGLGWVDHG